MREMFRPEVGEGIVMDVEDRRIVLGPKKTMENPVGRLYGSVKVKPEASPKKVAREWVMKKVLKEI